MVQFDCFCEKAHLWSTRSQTMSRNFFYLRIPACNGVGNTSKLNWTEIPYGEKESESNNKSYRSYDDLAHLY